MNTLTDRSKVQDILRDQLNTLLDINDGIGNVSQDLFTETMFVSKEGDNTDGMSWETAYNDPHDAIAAADINGYTRIIIGAGEFDANVGNDGFMPFTKKICFEGVSREATILTNSHTGASSVIGLNAPGMVRNLTVSAREFSRSIELNNNSDYSVIEKVDIKGRNAFTGAYMDGPTSGIQCDGVTHCFFDDIRIIGERGTTDGIEVMEDSSMLFFRNIQIHYCQYPIRIDGLSGQTSRSARRCTFDNIQLFDNLHGIQIGTGCYRNYFENVRIHETSSFIEGIEPSIINNGEDNRFYDLQVSPRRVLVAPENTTGATITCDAAADTWGDWVEIVRPNRMFFPLFAKLANPSNPNGVYRVQIAVGVSRIVICEEVMEINGGYFMEDGKIRITWAKGFCYCANRPVWIRAMSDSLAADTIDAFLTYQVV